MKFLFLFALLIYTLVTSLSADLIILENGASIKGQLLKVSDYGLIIEQLQESGQVTTITLRHDEVISVMDETETILYEKNRLWPRREMP